MVRTGRCLCGHVRYELAGELPPLVNCHCQFCRRAQGNRAVLAGAPSESALPRTARAGGVLLRGTLRARGGRVARRKRKTWQMALAVAIMLAAILAYLTTLDESDPRALPDAVEPLGRE